MIRLLCTKFSLVNPKASNFNHNGLYLSIFTLRPISKMSNSTDPHSFTVTYLQKSCGLSQESAISASKKISIETPEKADSFLKLMRTHGLTETHLRKIIEVRPSLLLADLEHRIRPNLELLESLGISGPSLGKSLCKDPFMLISQAHEFVEFFRAQNLSDERIRAIITTRPMLLQLSPTTNFKPKLEFLKSLGLTDKEASSVLSSATVLLERSLENKIIPCTENLRRIFGPEIFKAVRFWRYVVHHDSMKILEPNVSLMKNRGVPESSILAIIKLQPSILLSKLDRLREILEEVSKMGFEPDSKRFFVAIRYLSLIGKTGWDRKLEAFESRGFSTDEIYPMFGSQPMVMRLSVTKIQRSVDFYTSKLKMKPSEISERPHLLRHSLEKNVRRCSVLQVLMLKNVLNREISISTFLRMTDKRFADKTVSRFSEAIPDVVKANKGEIVFREFPNVLWLRK